MHGVHDMTKKIKLPFSMMPASWGLKGKARARAEAEYYYDGDELEKALAAIDAETDLDKQIAELDIDLKNGKIGIAEHEKAIAELKEEPYVNVLKMDLKVSPEFAEIVQKLCPYNIEFKSTKGKQYVSNSKSRPCLAF